MSKETNFAEITPNIPFTEFVFYELYRRTFINTELGRMKSLLSLREMRKLEHEHKDAKLFTERER